MIAAFAKGDVARAREVNARSFDSYGFETGDAAPNPIPTKAMMRVLGLPVGQCRLPDGPGPRGPRRPGSAGPRRPRRRLRRAARGLTAPVRITFLGGLGEIGRNCACVEQDGRILLLDCGLMFPDAEMPGVDLVLPDFTWLRENADRVEGCIVTHGHEDHMGALSFLLRDLSFPIYGSALTLGPGPQPHRGGRPARPHRADHRWPTASGAGSAPSTASSSPSPTRCPTGSPPPSTRPRA